VLETPLTSSPFAVDVVVAITMPEVS